MNLYEPEKSQFNRFLGGGKAKKVALPPDPDPVPTPEELNLEADVVGQRARRKRGGRSSLILTDQLGSTVSNGQPKNSVLGVSS